MQGIKLFLTAAVTLLGAVAAAQTGAGAPGRESPAAGVPAALGSPAAAPLADTQWRLVEFRSMDDAAGVKRPDDPSRYTMRLSRDGTVALRLNCNSANGRWSSEAGPDPTSGRFEFGPLAATSALCPPPSMDEMVSSQAPYVRSYLLKDGRLYLSLMADGGIYVWEPQAGEPFLSKADPELEAAILRASPHYTRAVGYPSPPQPRTSRMMDQRLCFCSAPLPRIQYS